MKSFRKFVKEGTKEEYNKLFDAKLKKYGVDSPEDLSDEEKNLYNEKYLLFYKNKIPPLPSDNLIKLYYKMVADSITLKDMTAIELCWHA